MRALRHSQCILRCRAESGQAFSHFATPDRSAAEFAHAACELAMQYPQAQTIHLLMDNLNIHHRKSLTDLVGEQVGGEIWDRFTVHYTPKHGSWLNRAEIEIGMFRGNASAAEEFRTSRPFAAKAEPGTAGRIAPVPKSTGSSTAKKPAGSSAARNTLLKRSEN
ncbi:MAG: transposase [Bryobacteraceae bacterium]